MIQTGESGLEFQEEAKKMKSSDDYSERFHELTMRMMTVKRDKRLLLLLMVLFLLSDPQFNKSCGGHDVFLSINFIMSGGKKYHFTIWYPDGHHDEHQQMYHVLLLMFIDKYHGTCILIKV